MQLGQTRKPQQSCADLTGSNRGTSRIASSPGRDEAREEKLPCRVFSVMRRVLGVLAAEVSFDRGGLMSMTMLA